MRALCCVAVVLCCAACPTTGGGDGGSSSGASGGGGGDAAVGRDSGGSSTGGPRQCGGNTCMFSEICVLTTDGGQCTPSCLADGGCAAGLVCRALAADGGIRACVAGGGVGDPCGGPQGCLSPLMCAAPPDAGASCRQPCNVVVDDAGILDCPSGYVCFSSVDDGGPGACFPR